jgi:hypothetical protein
MIYHNYESIPTRIKFPPLLIDPILAQTTNRIFDDLPAPLFKTSRLIGDGKLIQILSLHALVLHVVGVGGAGPGRMVILFSGNSCCRVNF